jgi:hypothetical protein
VNNREALQKIIGELEDLIEATAKVNAEDPAPGSLKEGIDFLIAVGKIRTAQDILKNVHTAAARQRF